MSSSFVRPSTPPVTHRIQGPQFGWDEEEYQYIRDRLYTVGQPEAAKKLEILLADGEILPNKPEDKPDPRFNQFVKQEGLENFDILPCYLVWDCL